MLVGLLSDTHDRLPAIEALCEKLTAAGVTLIMHAGDYCAPFALEPVQRFNVPLLGTFGKNDGDQEGLRAVAARGVGTELYESPHSLELAGKRILLVHELSEVNGRSIEAHDFVVHGFTHRHDFSRKGSTVLVNPGEACGWLTGNCTAAILDIETGHVELISA